MTNPKLATLIDAFTGTTINTTLWNASTGGGVLTLDTVNNRVQIAVGTTSGTKNSLAANGPYDATSSSIYARIGAAPNGNGGVSTVMKLAVDANNYIQALTSSGGTFTLQVITAGVTATTTLPSYNPVTHGWWRLAENAGSFTFSTSPDGISWTTLATLSHSWSATAMTVTFQTSTSDTEPAGQQAWIAHVNTPAGGTLNPNWPVASYEWGPRWNCNGAAQPLDRYVSVASRTRNRTGIQRGRQYELDQIRAGTLDMTLVNADGALDPLNTGGPWYGHIMPYQPARLRAQWPPTINLLTQAQASGGDLGGYGTGAIPGSQQGVSVFSDTDSAGGTIVSTTSAWQGATVFQFAVPSTSTAGQFPCWTPQVPVEPGTTYSQQIQVRNVTGSTSMQVQAIFEWHSATGSVISSVTGATATLSGATAATWTQITATSTAPSNSAYMAVGVKLVSPPASAASLQVDGWQIEKAVTPSAWVAPGVWYPLWSGFVERWPSSWTMQGTYGLVQPTGVDTLSLLSQRVLRDPLTEEIYSRNPRFLFTLADPQGSQSFTDAIGAFPPAPLAISRYGAGALASGNQITSATSGGTYTGSTGTVVTVSNPNPGTSLVSAATFISLSSAGVQGPADPTTWSRMIAFRYTGPTPTSGGNAVIWSAMDGQRANNAPSGSRINIGINNSGYVYATVGGPGGTGTTIQDSNVNVLDGNWHLVFLSFSVSLGALQLNVDNASGVLGGITSAYAPSGMISDCLGTFVDATVGNGTTNTYQGDISFAAEFPAFLYAADVTSLYSAWKNSFTGDSSDTRYNRILGWAGFTGPTSIQTGLTTSMGAAATGGQDALSALQAVVDTENGEHYVDRQGWVTFKSRAARYNALTPMYTFGERTDLGEIPYDEVQLDYDPTRLANQIKVTQASTNQVFSAQDTTSITNYFPRQLTRAVNSSNTQECQDAANYLLSRYKNPAVRLSALKLHPSANPGLLWPVCLSLELGTRVRVMRRPPSPAAAIQADCFIENIQWELDDQGEAHVTLQCSPADLTPYGLFASWHSALDTSYPAGYFHVTFSASADNTNPVAAQIGVGQQITIDPGTSVAETLTVSSVPPTSSGWTQGTLYFTTATAHAHSAGAVICEALPTGITSASTWDATSKFDSVAFAY